MRGIPSASSSAPYEGVGQYKDVILVRGGLHGSALGSAAFGEAATVEASDSEVSRHGSIYSGGGGGGKQLFAAGRRRIRKALLSSSSPKSRSGGGSGIGGGGGEGRDDANSSARSDADQKRDDVGTNKDNTDVADSATGRVIDFDGSASVMSSITGIGGRWRRGFRAGSRRWSGEHRWVTRGDRRHTGQTSASNVSSDISSSGSSGSSSSFSACAEGMVAGLPKKHGDDRENDKHNDASRLIEKYFSLGNEHFSKCEYEDALKMYSQVGQIVSSESYSFPGNNKDCDDDDCGDAVATCSFPKKSCSSPFLKAAPVAAKPPPSSSSFMNAIERNKLNNEGLLSRVSANIGAVYIQQEQYSDALAALETALLRARGVMRISDSAYDTARVAYERAAERASLAAERADKVARREEREEAERKKKKGRGVSGRGSWRSSITVDDYDHDYDHDDGSTREPGGGGEDDEDSDDATFTSSSSVMAYSVAVGLSRSAFAAAEAAEALDEIRFKSTSAAADALQNMALLHQKRGHPPEQALGRYHEALVVRRECLALAVRRVEEAMAEEAERNHQSYYKAGSVLAGATAKEEDEASSFAAAPPFIPQESGRGGGERLRRRRYEEKKCKIETSDLLSVMGAVHDERGEHSASAKLYREAVDLLCSAYGCNDRNDDAPAAAASSGNHHPDVAAVLYKLAKALSETDRYDEARECLESVRSSLRSRLGESHIDLADVTNDLAELYYHMGDWDACKNECRMSANLCAANSPNGDRVFGNECTSLKLAAAMNVMGMACSRTGHSSDAIKSFGRALFIRRSVLGQDHPKVIESLSLSADSYFDLGMIAEAERAYRATVRVVSKSDPIKPADYAAIAHALNRMGLIEVRRMNLEAAAKCFTRELLAWEKKREAENDDVKHRGKAESLRIAETRRFLGEVFQKLDLRGRAVEQFTLALATYRDVGLVPDDTNVVATIRCLAANQRSKN